MSKVRPVVVFQNNELNHSDYPTTIIIPLSTSLIDDAEPLRMRISKREDLERTCIVVVEVTGEKGKKKIGIVVDHVAEVIEIKNNELEDYEEDAQNLQDFFINGIAKVKDKIIIILDIISVVSKAEINN
jgi:chemotaxis signal transduction protein